jgi:hypothetical protein
MLFERAIRHATTGPEKIDHLVEHRIEVHDCPPDARARLKRHVNGAPKPPRALE